MEDKWLEDLKDLKYLNEKDLKKLCQKAIEIFLEESNVQIVHAPVIICGNIHGQIYDLLEIFKKGGDIPNNRYIFMGDYIDRGNNGVEVLELLLVLKIKYPGHITLLRGNHECQQISSVYGFYEEIIRKYGNANVWEYFIDLFDFMPLAALVEGKLFCVHGGLSPFISTIDQIRLIPRKMEIPRVGGFCDLMWSDPDDIETWLDSPRGAGHLFGWKPSDEFTHINGLELICRSHQIVMEGFKYWFKNKNVCTVWSCPNYCYNFGNKASILKINFNLSRTVDYFDSSEKSMFSDQPKTLLP